MEHPRGVLRFLEPLRRPRIAVQVWAWLILISILPLAIASYVAYRSSGATLRREALARAVLEADDLTHNIFHRTFRNMGGVDAAALDAVLVSELRDSRPIGNLTLQCGAAEEVLNVRRSARLDDLEQAVLQLPPTERMIYLLHDGEGYASERVGALIGLAGDDVRAGLHQARLRVRELLAA